MSLLFGGIREIDPVPPTIVDTELPTDVNMVGEEA